MTSRVPHAFALLAVAAAVAVTAGCATREVPVPVPTAAAPSSAVSPAPSSSGTPTSTGSTGQDGGRCLLSDLSAEAAGPQGGSGQREVRVVWTNISDRSCSMTGFGGVDLVASPRSEDRYSLPRQERSTSTVRLAPGERAHSTITYLSAPEGSDGAYAATKLWATPPDETHSMVLDWPGGPVLRQDGATRPGSYLGPVEAGAD